MIRGFNGKTPQIHETAFVSEAAYVIGNVEIGENSSVWPGAVIRGDYGRIVIGKNTVVQDNSVLHVDEMLTIGDDTMIGHNATVHGSKLGNRCLVANGAVVLDGAEIGDDCFIVAGALVTPNTKIPDGSVVMGNPAKIKNHITEEKLTLLSSGIDGYRNLAKEYKAQGL